MKRVLILVAAVAALANSASANSITSLYNTGVDASHAVLPDGYSPDPHYTLTAVPGGTNVTLIRTSAGGFPIGPYIGDDLLSAWVGPNNYQLYGPEGSYTYKTTFDLAGLDPATASITGLWSSDNDGMSIRLNGSVTSNPGTPAGQYSSFAPFTISSGFIAGLNTLEFVVYNGGGPTALRVEMTGTADESAGGGQNAVPLPAAAGVGFAMLGGIGMFAGLRKRLRRQSRIA